MVIVKVVGSIETLVVLSRVPCVGETVQVQGRARTVTGVEHLAQEWDAAPAPAAIVTAGP